MRVLVVDNYDSFAYNLVQYVGALVTGADGSTGRRDGAVEHGEVLVRRNDAVDLDGIDALDPDAIVVSPGPGTPAEAGVSAPLFAERSYPTLGVCLGHQALCAANGAPVGHAESVVHGKRSRVTHDGEGVFAGLPDPLAVGRYHSLTVGRGALPDALVETASTDQRGIVMGVRHRRRPHVGVQFHPESILTEAGRGLLANFLAAHDPDDRLSPPDDTADAEPAWRRTGTRTVLGSDGRAGADPAATDRDGTASHSGGDGDE